MFGIVSSVTVIDISSANPSRIANSVHSLMSARRIIKKIGDSTDPCGAPMTIVSIEDVFDSNWTNWDLFVK